MQTRKIGALDVSVVGLGCNNFGMMIDAAQTSAVVDAAIDAGVNYFDTAESYGRGQSEEFLGAALAGRRADVLIATKWGHTTSLADGE
jgi:aryl-alcohol dehydrogenase-like predicted oxidoreductase